MLPDILIILCKIENFAKYKLHRIEIILSVKVFCMLYVTMK